MYVKETDIVGLIDSDLRMAQLHGPGVSRFSRGVFLPQRCCVGSWAAAALRDTIHDTR